MKRKTATIERYPVFGTWRYELRLMYRGRVVNYWTAGYARFLIVQHLEPSDITAARGIAKTHNFTHVKFTGDWDRMTKPRGGKL